MSIMIPILILAAIITCHLTILFAFAAMLAFLGWRSKTGRPPI